MNWHGKNELNPVYFENNIFGFCLNREVKFTETNNVNNAQQSGNGDGSAVRSYVQRKLSMEMSHQVVMASNQLGNLVQMSKGETKKMRNPWKQKFPESE